MQIALPPYLNWSNFVDRGDEAAASEASLVQLTLLPGDGPGALLPPTGVPLTLRKGTSALGGNPFSDASQRKFT